LVITVRGSIWSSDFIVAAGGPGGESGPWARTPRTVAHKHAPVASAILGIVFITHPPVSGPPGFRRAYQI
jgi:hypothetical protein